MKKFLGLIVSLTIIAAVCAALLAYINVKTAEPIKKAAAEKRILMAKAVMPSIVVSIDEEDGFFIGKDASGSVAGFALEGSDMGGYGGEIVLMVGFEADKKTVVAYKNLKSSETPGLGSKLQTPEFSGHFEGKDVSLWKLKKDGGEIDAITAATITSRAVCKAVADAEAKLQNLGK